MNEYTSKGGVARSHSNNGNLQDDGARIFQYDYKNRLVAVWDKASNTPRSAYLYYGDGRRARKVLFSSQTPGVIERETQFFYDGWQVCEEQNAQGLTETTYVYGHYVDDLVQFVRTTAHPLGAGTFYSHCNARFDVVATTDASGQVVERRFYDDFGRQFGADKQPVAGSAVGNPYGFQGRRLDVESGLYYFRHRYYDPERGRFVQRDPVWDPGNVGNQYSFVGNGPNSSMDPFGLSATQFLESFIRGFYAGGAAFGKGMAALGGMIVSAFTGGDGFSKMKVDAEMVIDLAIGIMIGWGRLLGPAFVGDIAYAVTKASAKSIIGAFSGQDRVCTFAFEFAKGLGGAILGTMLAKAIQSLGRSSQAAKNADDLPGNAGKAADEAEGGAKITEGGGPGCFLAGTFVETRDGRKKIEAIEVGDLVLSRDEATGEVGYQRVSKLNRGNAVQVCRVTVAPHRRGRTETYRVGEATAGNEGSDDPPLASQGILSTRDHPYYSVSRRTWIDADALKPGELLRASDGSLLTVVKVEHWVEDAKTYNFEVEDWHSYFVSEADGQPGIWVHNGPDIDSAAEALLNRPRRPFADMGPTGQGHWNYVLRDPNGRVYYSGMSDEVLADGRPNTRSVERRHGNTGTGSGQRFRSTGPRADTLEVISRGQVYRPIKAPGGPCSRHLRHSRYEQAWDA